jgi:hypothetical protein
VTKAEAVKAIEVGLDPHPKGERQALGGAASDKWNDRLAALVASALPVNQGDTEALTRAAAAALSGMVDIKPADPIEGVLIGQLIVAHEAALSMYRCAWQQPSEYFEARTKYLALADKAARTVALLTEALDRHRGRGQQQIIVKHVTVNADQAVVADQFVTGGEGVRGKDDKQPHAQAAPTEQAQETSMREHCRQYGWDWVTFQRSRKASTLRMVRGLNMLGAEASNLMAVVLAKYDKPGPKP